jgi:hypothetical protein
MQLHDCLPVKARSVVVEHSDRDTPGLVAVFGDPIQLLKFKFTLQFTRRRLLQGLGWGGLRLGRALAIHDRGQRKKVAEKNGSRYEPGAGKTQTSSWEAEEHDSCTSFLEIDGSARYPNAKTLKCEIDDVLNQPRKLPRIPERQRFYTRFFV